MDLLVDIVSLIGPEIQQVCNGQRSWQAQQWQKQMAHMCSNARVKPACVVVVAHEGFMLNHVGRVVHRGSDLSSDLDLLQRHHHGPDGAFTAVPLGKQVPKLHHSRDQTCCDS